MGSVFHSNSLPIGRRKSSPAPMAGFIADEDLPIPVPIPTLCLPARSTHSGSKTHTSIDARQRSSEFDELRKRGRYDLHIYPSPPSTAAPGGRHSSSSASKSTLTKLKKKVTAPKLMFSDAKLQANLQGYNVYFSKCDEGEKCDFLMLFTDKAYAKKHLQHTVKDLAAFSIKDGGGSSPCFRVYVMQTSDGNLSVRIALAAHLEELFYQKISSWLNNLAVGSVDVPFPSNIAELTDSQKKRLLYVVLANILGKRGVLLPQLLFPSHRKAICREIWKEHTRSLVRLLYCDADEMRIAEYFGEEVAFYFAWMNHYKRWLIAASVLGAVTTLAGTLCGFDSLSNQFAPFCTLILIIGMVLCVKMWERKCELLAMRFKMLHSHVKDEKNWQFKGDVVNPVTGKKDYYPSWKRGCILQPLSWAVSLSYVGLTIFVTLCFLNAEGETEKESMLSIEFFRRLSEPGNLFGKDSPYQLSLLVLFPVSTMVLSKLFDYVARKLTEFENYQRRGEYIRAFTQKRVTLEAINRYAKLFFFIFVRQDMATITDNVRLLFIIDEAIRMFTEVLLPFVTSHRAYLMAVFRKNVVLPTPIDEYLSEYEIYSDFVQMAVQLGYIALFATAYPIAPLFALIVNTIEMHCDLFKLCFVVRRPIPRYGVSQLSVWSGVFRLFAVGAILTNTFLIVFAGSQIHFWLPNSSFSKENSIILFAVLEHLLLVLCGFLFWRIPAQPRAVKRYINERRLQSSSENGFSEKF